MKKIIFIIAALLLATIELSAVPAYRGLVNYTQPDGSVIQIRLHGDEFFSWTTDASGQIIELRSDGYYYPVSGFMFQTRRAQGARLRAQVNASRRRSIGRSNVASGQKHFLVILVEFNDVRFSSSTANEDFYKLMNQPGYSLNGATGSARDFYYENSHGAFEPIFDVYGPVTLTKNQSVYGGNSSSQPGSDKAPYLAVKEGCEALAGEIDFSKFDNDNDGEVDLVFMYYAGKGEADGGGSNCIWPHQWELSNGGISLTLGGKKINKYACSNEIVNYGALYGKMCGIGTACHEFGHAMGLPDFYDTDDSDNGSASGLYDFSTMCGGCYNNDGRTPPYFNMEERIMLGWLEPSAIQEIKDPGSYTLQSVQNNTAYKTSCDMDGEYFIFEARDGQGWDTYIPGGLLAYHVDKSDRIIGRVSGRSVSAKELWNNWEMYNAINAFGSHPCFYIVPSSDNAILNDPSLAANRIIFPGALSVSSYRPVDWDNQETAVSLSGISYNSGVVTFNVTISNSKGVSGYVTDSSGSPLQGVAIHVDPLEDSSSASGMPKIRTVKPQSFKAPYIVQTDSQGHFEIDLQSCSAEKVELSAYLDGYVSTSQILTLKPKGNAVSIVMLRQGETLPTDLYKYNPSGSVVSLGIDGYDLMASVRFTSEELAEHAGSLIKSVSFLPTCTSASALYVIVDFGSTRALTYNVPVPSFSGSGISVSLESQNLHIPEDSDMYIGYGLVGANPVYSLGCIKTSSFNGTYYGVMDTESSDWYQLSTTDGGYYDLVLSVTVKKEDEDPGNPPVVTDDPIAKMGFSYIDIPADLSLTAGTVLPLRLVTGKGLTVNVLTWLLDGNIITEDSITLTGGTHSLRAVIVYNENNYSESIEVELEVQ